MLKKLAERVYYMPHYSETDRPALGFISGDTISLIVDAGNSPAHANDFLNLVQEVDHSKQRFVAITHWHWDHIFGIETMGLPTISHEETKKVIDHLKTLEWDDASLDARVESGEEIEFCRDMIKREMPTRDHLVLKSPNITFSDKMEIDLGGITCVIDHVGGEHAKDSSIVYVPEEKIMFLADCLYQDFYSGDWSYDLHQFKTLVEKIKQYEVNTYVLGHQDPHSREELWKFLDEIISIGEIVGDEMDLEEAITKFTDVRKSTPTEDQREFIENFINGNQKRIGA
ncbi:MBL fold metallo-hydrolase [Ureibacillus acetophenoni]|uniref:Glyoxylase-like metal-dependent hydrolase (Beta-lactamase superfamily II) n=1 Tax=Ureibacillus acetophenoni TaxID=614649 RepID=A0A285URH7_9BACL|nr:MBL fold metallo-hydrolase [Ureibacillus acetophenoni]SOC44515.1 glyoxylase-like metal-dependent hydrolase (beta-lactamase superfamily II) [Ureibacillus acetophenoni]